MRRGTSPTLKLTTDQDWTGYEVVVTIEESSNGNNVELNFKNEQLTIDGNTIYVALTQNDTLKFQKKAQIQIKGKKGNQVIATEISKIPILPILNEEVM